MQLEKNTLRLHLFLWKTAAAARVLSGGALVVDTAERSGMTIRELGERFCLSVEKLKKYEACGLIAGTEDGEGERQYGDEVLGKLGLICTLTEAGFSCEEIKQYLTFPEDSRGARERILMLKRRRGEMLDEIHRRQKLLDKIDFLIWKNKKKEA